MIMSMFWRNVVKLISYIFVLFLLVGCGANTITALTGIPVKQSAKGDVFNQQSILENKAVVYIYRPDKLFNSAGWPNIFVNGNKEFSLKNNGYGVFQFDTGNYVFLAKGSKFLTNWYPSPASLEIKVEAGKEYYIRVTPQADDIFILSGIVAVTGSAQVVQVDREFALTEISKSKRAN